MSKFLRRSLLIFIIKVFRTIVFIFIIISTTFRPICPPAFFRCLSNSGTFTELRTTSFIETSGVACSDSVSISSDTDAYKEEMISLRHNLHRNNYPESITSAPRNLDRRVEDNTRKLTAVCLPYVKGLAERIKKICSPYDIRTVFTSGSTLWRFLFWVKLPMEFNMTKNCIYSIPCSCGKIYKGETGRPLKVRLEEHRKAIVRGEIEKSGMVDHIWKENGNHLPLWDKVEIIDRAEHWRIRRLKESAHMLGYNDLLSRTSIELNTIWEPIIKKAR